MYFLQHNNCFLSRALTLTGHSKSSSCHVSVSTLFQSALHFYRLWEQSCVFLAAQPEKLWAIVHNIIVKPETSEHIWHVTAQPHFLLPLSSFVYPGIAALIMASQSLLHWKHVGIYCSVCVFLLKPLPQVREIAPQLCHLHLNGRQILEFQHFCNLGQDFLQPVLLWALPGRAADTSDLYFREDFMMSGHSCGVSTLDFPWHNTQSLARRNLPLEMY